MMRITSAALAALAISACASSNNAPGGAINAPGGAILDGTVHGPAALTIDVPGTALSTRTDHDGNFALPDAREGDTAVHFRGQGVDARLSLPPLSRGEHRSISVSVVGHVAIEHHEVYEVELRGAIDSISAPSLVVAGTTVNTTTATTFEKSGATIAFADLKAGDSVEAEGKMQPDGSLLARSVKVDDGAKAADAGAGESEEQGQVLVVGPAAAVSSTNRTVTVGSTVVNVDEHTTFHGQGSFASLADVHVGDSLEIEAVKSGGSLLANRVDRLDEAE